MVAVDVPNPEHRWVWWGTHASVRTPVRGVQAAEDGGVGPFAEGHVAPLGGSHHHGHALPHVVEWELQHHLREAAGRGVNQALHSATRSPGHTLLGITIPRNCTT